MRLRDETKERTIREKAIEMIVREGFDGLSMQKLAKAAGVSPATIYIYFQDREDLIRQIYFEESTRMSDITLNGFDPDMPFEEGLRVQWKNRITYCLQHPMRMHFMEQMRHSPFHEKFIRDANNPFIAAMGTFVKNAIRRNELVKLPVEVYWSIAFAPLYQLLKFHMSSQGMPETTHFVLDEALIDQTLELVLKALKP
ncbi:TetR/AcrR family transcriptional regulator [Larkinella punicea]|uniref:TetR/AcrR family transcriptional regulator n=1 Tax=Larkinella punicea TaxID=2315727 RepID=A0A368JUU1_9BACT|nr:TetR/AcrR family transcriptional regulator [Larkinella punicea]RCR70434.1 TetR/AcrR family transcriptional regulator [Larkinella punicea]